MKKILTVLIVVLVALFALSIVKDAVIKTSVEKVAQFVTGLKLSIGSFRAGIVNTLVDIKNLKLFNPSGYKDAAMLEMSEIYVKYDLPAIFKKKIHLPELRIDMKEFTVVKNEKGELNLDSLKAVQAQKTSPGKEGGKLPELAIDNFQLKIGKVIFKDYSQGGAPSVREFNINLNEKYTNVTNAYSLVSLIVVKALMNTSIASLTNFDLTGLQDSVSDVLGNAQKVTTETVQKVQEAAKAAAQEAQAAAKKVEETTKKAQEAAASAQKALQEQLNKLPFGGGKK
jgi:ElaB/YqjD/DUF883 family membrane-anchored ribosome-binding protein